MEEFSGRRSSAPQLKRLIAEAGVQEGAIDRVIDFLLYYGVIGLRAAGDEHFIYDINYDMKLLKIRAARMGEAATYTVNPAFWPALGIREAEEPLPEQPRLL